MTKAAKMEINNVIDSLVAIEDAITKSDTWGEFRYLNEDVWHSCTNGDESAIMFLNAVIEQVSDKHRELYGYDTDGVTIQ